MSDRSVAEASDLHNTHIYAVIGIFFILYSVLLFYFFFLVSLRAFCPYCLCFFFLSVLYNSYNTNIDAFSGIRTRNPSSRADADLRLRPHDYHNRCFVQVRKGFVRIITLCLFINGVL
jgi:hypothetical protein